MVRSVGNVSSDQDYDTSFADSQSSAAVVRGLDDDSICRPTLNIAYRPSRRVPYMQNIDGIVALR
jgi:hypothetical protein